jgi:hypothetical protein
VKALQRGTGWFAKFFGLCIIAVAFGTLAYGHLCTPSGRKKSRRNEHRGQGETLVRAAGFCSTRLRQGASGTSNEKARSSPGASNTSGLACGNELKNSLPKAQTDYTNSTSFRFASLDGSR